MHAVDALMIEHRGAVALDSSTPSSSTASTKPALIKPALIKPARIKRVGNEWRGLVVGAGRAVGFVFITNHLDDAISMPTGGIFKFGLYKTLRRA